MSFVFVFFVVSLLRCLLAVGGDGEKATLTQTASDRAALPRPVLAVPADDAHTLEQLRLLKPKSKATDPSQVCRYLFEALCEQALLQADGMDLQGLPERARRWRDYVASAKQKRSAAIAARRQVSYDAKLKPAIEASLQRQTKHRRVRAQAPTHAYVLLFRSNANRTDAKILAAAWFCNHPGLIGACAL